MNRHRQLAPLAVAVLLLTGASPAWAYLTATGSGRGGADVATLTAPTDVTATSSGDQVEVSWTTAAAPDGGPLGYVVTRTSTSDGTVVDVCGSDPDPVVDAATCDDEGVPPGSYQYTVTATFGGWTASGTPSDPVEVGGEGTATTLDLSPSTATYGAEDSTAFVVAVDTDDGGTPTGTIDVSTGGTDLCTITLPDASCSPDPGALDPAASPYPVVATYSGDDSYAGSVSAPEDLTVYDAPIITTTTLAPAMAGETGYSETLTATGGLPDLTWTVSRGYLPTGLSLDASTGMVSGTLLSSDSSEQFVITVTDADGATASASYTLTVTSILSQQVSTRTTSNASSVTVTLPLPVDAGDALVLSLDQACTTASGSHVDAHVSAVSGDSLTWTRAAATGCSTDGDAELWYGLDAPAAGAGTKVTVTLATADVVQFANVSEYAGVASRDASSGSTAVATGTGATAAPGSVTPATAGELVVSDSFVTRATPTSLSGLVGSFVPLNPTSPYDGFGVYAVDATTGPLTPTYTQTVAGTPTAGPWSSVASAFVLAS